MSRALKRLALISAVTVFAVFWAGGGNPGATVFIERPEKVDRQVIRKASEGKTEFLVFLTEQADLSGAGHLAGKAEKGLYVVRALTAAAERTQGPVIEALQALGADFRPFWVANMIWVRGGAEVVNAMAARPDVARVHANPSVRLQQPFPSAAGAAQKSPAAIQWNIAKVNAPAVWDAGFTGQGAVVAGQDTGYQWDHPALKRQYRGWNGTSADHDYNWHDAVHSGGDESCPADSPVPCDDYGHGTHTMGTMVGDDGDADRIGMAPGARWIGCRNMDDGVGTPATYAECFQWFIAPTRVDGSGADPAMAPDVIDNSWSCTPSEGCEDPNVLLKVVKNVRAAGILTVQSAGNAGAPCETVMDPAAIYGASFTVGATDRSDVIATFSSRGPVTSDGSNRRKPDISAPGVSIRSSFKGGGYSIMSGTSMAAPHVAGLTALLVSANSRLSGQVDLLERIAERTALHLVTSQGCGDDGPTDVPNNVYGWGRIDAYAAYRRATSTGTLQVTLGPQRAVAAGGRWRVDGGPWKVDGQQVSGLAAGGHTVELKIVAGWKTPVVLTAVVEPGRTTRLSADYSRPNPASWLPLLLRDGSLWPWPKPCRARRSIHIPAGPVAGCGSPVVPAGQIRWKESFHEHGEKDADIAGGVLLACPDRGKRLGRLCLVQLHGGQSRAESDGRLSDHPGAPGGDRKQDIHVARRSDGQAPGHRLERGERQPEGARLCGLALRGRQSAERAPGCWRGAIMERLSWWIPSPGWRRYG